MGFNVERFSFVRFLSKFQPWTVQQCHHCQDIDTFDHLQRSSCNPVSWQHALDLRDKVTAYFDRHQTPVAFQTTFLLCLMTWLEGTENIDTESPDWRGSPALHCEQQAIRWRLLVRGFLSSQWHKFLQQSLHNDKWRLLYTDLPKYSGPLWTTVGTPSSASWSTAGNMSDNSIDLFEPEYYVEFAIPSALHCNGRTSSIDPTIFLAGLIKILWSELSNLRQSHLDHIHNNKESKASPVTLAESILRLRILHQYQETVEEALRTKNRLSWRRHSTGSILGNGTPPT
jgi:hypothetical protein